MGGLSESGRCVHGPDVIRREGSGQCRSDGFVHVPVASLFVLSLHFAEHDALQQ